MYITRCKTIHEKENNIKGKRNEIGIPSEPVARKEPSGENLTTFTALVCLVRLAKKSSDAPPSTRLPTFQIFIHY